MLEKVGIEDLRARLIIHMAGLMYKRSFDPGYLDERQIPRPTRQFDKKILKIPDVDLTKTFKCPIYYGSSLWNALPHDIQNAETYKIFKHQFKQQLH